MKTVRIVLIATLMAASLCACTITGASEMENGYYTAECLNFDEYGWKEYITIYVNNNKIVMVEYNAKNASGFIKSWDNDYMRVMNREDGTYPNKYARAYAADLLYKQEPSRVDTITGATHSSVSFKLLAAAAIDQAKAGDKNVAYIDLPEFE